MPEEEHSPEATETAVEEQGPIEAVAGQFGLNGQIFVAQLLNFLIVLVVMWRFVYKPVVRMLDERSEKIAKSVKHAEDIESRLKEIQAEREQVMIAAAKEAKEIATKAHTDAEARGEQMIQAAKREVERVVSKGKVTLAEEKDAMMRELRKEVIDLAMKAAARILQDEVNEKKSRSLAEEVVRKLA